MRKVDIAFCSPTTCRMGVERIVRDLDDRFQLLRRRLTSDDGYGDVGNSHVSLQPRPVEFRLPTGWTSDEMIQEAARLRLDQLVIDSILQMANVNRVVEGVKHDTDYLRMIAAVEEANAQFSAFLLAGPGSVGELCGYPAWRSEHVPDGHALGGQWEDGILAVGKEVTVVNYGVASVATLHADFQVRHEAAFVVRYSKERWDWRESLRK